MNDIAARHVDYDYDYDYDNNNNKRRNYQNKMRQITISSIENVP